MVFNCLRSASLDCGLAFVAQDRFVVFDILREDKRRTVAFLGFAASGFAHFLKPAAIVQQADCALRHAIHVADRIEQTGVAIVDEFRNAADPSSDGGNLAGHGFQRRQSERLECAGHEHKVGERKQLVDAILLAEETDAVLNPKVVRQPLGCRAVGPVADQNQMRWNPA